MAWRVGVDSGGTFTDVCLFEESTRRIEVWKVPSTQDDPSRGIADGLDEGVRRLGASPADVGFFGHGTTVATNALIQHKGVRTGLITTDGFRDLLEIARQKRPDLYDLQADKSPILVSRDLRHEVAERVRYDGSIETPIDGEAVRSAVRELKAAGVEAVAICFLYGFVRPEHESLARDILAEEFPEAFASIAHEVAPEFREHERLSTTVVNAYLGPLMKGYINRLSQRLEALGLPVAPHLTQSNGGVISFHQAERLPVRTVLSGPSTGVVAAQALGRAIGIADLITFDMGGTSTDVALLRGGKCELTNEAQVHGYAIKAPMLDIHTVGAGGGSIVHVDSGGLLKVGPKSAGADPGPVAYGKGGTEPTVTDANIVLQTLNPHSILGGRMAVRQDLARAALQRIADQLGMDLMSTAQGVISVVTANMARAIRLVSVQRGHDPRDYALMAFGGAGPLHAARLARELGMERIVVPRYPGIACALGLILTDLRTDFAHTRIQPLDETALPSLRDIFAGLQARADAWFDEEAIADGKRQRRRTVDARYAGQNYELPIALADGELTAGTLVLIAEQFAREHRRLYGFVAEGEVIQLVTYRIEAAGIVEKAEFRPQAETGPDPSAALTGRREVWLPERGGFVSTPVYDRDRLQAGNRIDGPAIVEQMDATTFVLPGQVAVADPYGNLILEQLR